MKINRLVEFSSLFLLLVSIAWFIYAPGFEPFITAVGSLVSYVQSRKSHSQSPSSEKEILKENKQSIAEQKTVELETEKYDNLETDIYSRISKLLIENPRLSGRYLQNILQLYARNSTEPFSDIDIQVEWLASPLLRYMYIFLNKFTIATFISFIVVCNVNTTASIRFI